VAAIGDKCLIPGTSEMRQVKALLICQIVKIQVVPIFIADI